MFDITYHIYFFHIDGEKEEQIYTSSETAWKVFRTFIEPDSFDIYQSIKLVEYNHKEEQEYPLANVVFLD